MIRFLRGVKLLTVFLMLAVLTIAGLAYLWMQHSFAKALNAGTFPRLAYEDTSLAFQCKMEGNVQQETENENTYLFVNCSGFLE